MAAIVGVHGIMQEQFGRVQLRRAWEPALLDGVELAAGRSSESGIDFDLAFYADLFLSPQQQGDVQVKGGPARPEQDPADPGELAFLTQATNEIISVTPDLGAEMGITTVSPQFRPLVRALARHFDGRLVLPFLSVLRQVHTYQSDDILAERVRDRVVQEIGDGCRVLIGHSMGTLVALETLCLHPELPVDTLITLGAPLSMKTVAQALRGPAVRPVPPRPVQIRRWVNIFDPRDPVAGAGRADRLWPGVEDHGVDNGDLPHAIGHYLSKRITGSVIVDAMSRG